MAKYSITRSCGHNETVNICGTNAHGERERQAEYEARKLCYECYKSKQAEERKQAATAGAQQAQAENLPELTGSEKQIAWANQIRGKVLAELAELKQQAAAAGNDWDGAEAATVRGLVDQILAHTAASWWIDNRNETLRSLIRIAHAA